MTSFDSTVCFLLFLSVDFSGQSVKPSLMSTSGQAGMTSSSLSSGSRTRVKLSKDTWGSVSGLGVTSECCRVTCSGNENKVKGDNLPNTSHHHSNLALELLNMSCHLFLITLSYSVNDNAMHMFNIKFE